MASQINTTGKNAMLDELASLCTYAALYTDTAGTTEVSGGSPAYARKAITWAAASSGAVSLNGTLPTFDVPSGTTVRAVGFVTALTAGTQHAIDEVTAETFAGQGTYTLSSGTITLT
jgi:hypothetical protein